ncbi:autophagy protein 12-like [Leptopilina boulardi]|uniref:autophagy protein 12-like n=1 Tax=Leptopilina boulardi TaxID=63433 RepID=UPI0021F55628|nr:autophagy protein 12-like [Leptopilina boulardi]
MADEESYSMNEDVSKNNPVISETSNFDEPQDTACVETNLSANGNPQISAKDKSKIDILLKAAGDAPIMKKKKWAVNPDKHIGSVGEFIKKYIKLEQNEKLFLYINQTFAPAPDQTVQNLFDCYGTDGKLIIHYCKSQAWG